MDEKKELWRGSTCVPTPDIKTWSFVLSSVIKQFNTKSKEEPEKKQLINWQAILASISWLLVRPSQFYDLSVAESIIQQIILMLI